MENRKKIQRNSFQNSTSWKCEHCNVTFTKITEDKHLCEKKRRVLVRDEPAERLGFKLWLLIQHMYFTVEYFESSLYYKTFVGFAKHCLDSEYIEPFQYGKWALTNQIPFDKWKRFDIYKQFVSYFCSKEDPVDAIHRSLTYIQAKHYLGKYFDTMGCNRILDDIEHGRISPWLVLLASNIDNFMSRLNEEQIVKFTELIHINTWELRTKRMEEQVKNAKEMLQQVNI